MAYDQRSLDDYVDVAERIAEFRACYPDGCLRPSGWGEHAEPFKIIQVQGTEKNGEITQQTFIVYVAAAYRTPGDPRPGIGCAWEIWPGRTPYTRGSELMNAETSAWGRAIIAVLAADSKRGVASRQEVIQARERQAGDDPPAVAMAKTGQRQPQEPWVRRRGKIERVTPRGQVPDDPWQEPGELSSEPAQEAP